MKILFFCENRNGVHISKDIIESAKKVGVFDSSSCIVTCDWGGSVSTWVTEEYQALGLENECAFINLAEQSQAPNKDGFRSAVYDLIAALANREKYDVAILFNDQSVRGGCASSVWRHHGQIYYLVQDGFLTFDFKSLLDGEKDQNYHYGASFPAGIFVWGNRMRQQIGARINYPIDRIVESGAFGISDHPRFAACMGRTGGPIKRFKSGPLKVLLADQPLSDQRKISKSKWDESAVDLADCLKNFDLDIKPHPSSSLAHKESLRASFPKAVVLGDSHLLDESEIKHYDIVVTYFSSVFTQCLLAGVPVVFYSPEGCNTVFPAISHHLIANVYSIQELHDVLFCFQISGSFYGNEGFDGIEGHIAASKVPGDVVITHILGGLGAEKEAPRVRTLPAPVELPAIPAGVRDYLTRLFLSEAAPEEIVVIGDDLSERTGVAISILTYIRYALANTKSRIRVINAGATRSTGEILDVIGEPSHVIINSFAFFWRRRYAEEVTQKLLERRIPVCIYAHETEHAYFASAGAQEERHKKLLHLAPFLSVLCVSQKQAYFLGYQGFAKTIVVYECIPDMVVRELPVRQGNRVCMLGTIQARKGVDLFSRVADLSRERGYDLEFVWIGHKPRNFDASLYLSPNVEWLGGKPREEAEFELLKSDLFFLSSSDDPMPLSALEAIRAKMRLVTYVNVGTAEIMQGVSGYHAFHSYDAEHALNSILTSFSQNIDQETYSKVSENFNSREFSVRMNAALCALKNNPAEPVGRQPYADSSRTSGLVSMESMRELKLTNPGGAAAMCALLVKKPLKPAEFRECAGIFEEAGMWEDAENAYLASAIREPERALPWLKLSEISLLKEDRVLALAYAQRALEKNPSSRRAKELVENFTKRNTAEVRKN